MGFSTIAAQILFFIAVVGISAGVIAVFGSYIDQTKSAMSDKQQYIVGQLKTDIVISNIDNQSGHLFVFVKNVGKEQLKTDCINLYVDSGWVTVTPARITDPSTGSEATYLDSEDTIKIDPQAAPLGENSVHEAKVVTCNGVWDTESF